MPAAAWAAAATSGLVELLSRGWASGALVQRRRHGYADRPPNALPASPLRPPPRRRRWRLERTLFRGVERLARFLVLGALEVRLQRKGCLDLCCREASTVAFRCAWGAGWGVRV